jgi:hypothetical protein
MRNIKTKKKQKVLATVVALSIPFAALAQGGLFQRGEESIQNTGLLRNGGEAITLTNQGFGHPTEGVDVTNQTFGAPLGSGFVTLLVASAGYAASNSNRRNKKNKKENIK